MANASKYLVDSFYLPNVDLTLNRVSGARLCYNTDGQDPVIWYFSVNNKIYKYRIGKKAVVDSIDISANSDIISYGANYDWYIDSTNKLYLLYHGESKLRSLQPLQRINAILVFDKGTYHSINYHNTDSPKAFIYDAGSPLLIGNNILLRKQPYYYIYKPAERTQYFSGKVLSIFSIEDTNLVEKKNFAPFPDEYKKKYVTSQSPVACIAKDSLVYYCYPTNNVLYKYNINNDKTEEIRLRDIPKNKLLDYNVDSIRNFNYNVEYAISTDDYTSLSYDNYTGNIALLQTLGIDNNKPDSLGHVLSYSDKPVILYLLDASFKCIKKVKFDHQIFAKTPFLFRNRFYVPLFRDKELKIYVYAL